MNLSDLSGHKPAFIIVRGDEQIMDDRLKVLREAITPILNSKEIIVDSILYEKEGTYYSPLSHGGPGFGRLHRSCTASAH